MIYLPYFNVKNYTNKCDTGRREKVFFVFVFIAFLPFFPFFFLLLQASSPLGCWLASWYWFKRFFVVDHFLEHNFVRIVSMAFFFLILVSSLFFLFGFHSWFFDSSLRNVLVLFFFWVGHFLWH